MDRHGFIGLSGDFSGGSAGVQRQGVYPRTRLGESEGEGIPPSEKFGFLYAIWWLLVDSEAQLCMNLASTFNQF